MFSINESNEHLVRALRPCELGDKEDAMLRDRIMLEGKDKGKKKSKKNI